VLYRWKKKRAVPPHLSSSYSVGDIHAQSSVSAKDWRADMYVEAYQSGVINEEQLTASLQGEQQHLQPALASVSIKAGSIAFHHQDLWHGSGPNQSTVRWRRAIAVHLLRGDVQFKTHEPVGYIYGRYVMHRQTPLNDTEEKIVTDQQGGDWSPLLHERFFPILWRRDGYRSPFLNNYCQNLLP
jgi:hypothetical protein